jgi:predicted transposase/invertase (TIGR01784 family)
LNKLNKQHDAFARKYLSNIDVAKEFLSIYLEPEILVKCDIATLQIDNNSYIEPNLAAHYSDVVYKIKLLDNNSIFFFNLIEHQVNPEIMMPFRIMRYQVAIIQRYLEQNKQAKQLPLVVAFVFYTGKRSPYPYHVDVTDLFANRDLYTKAALGKFKLIDLTVIEDDELLQHKKLALLETLLKQVNMRSLNHKWIGKAIDIAATFDKNDLIYVAMVYLMNSTNEHEFKQLITQIEKESTTIKENQIMNYAEQLFKEGEQRGIELGKQEGIQLGEQRGIEFGRHEEQIKIARQLLKSGVNINIVSNATGLTLDQINNLK